MTWPNIVGELVRFGIWFRSHPQAYNITSRQKQRSYIFILSLFSFFNVRYQGSYPLYLCLYR